MASAAAQILGYGSASSLFSGGSISDQLNSEEELERKKRLAALAAARPGGVGDQYGRALSAAGQSLALGLS
jgi:hypothetical protein